MDNKFSNKKCEDFELIMSLYIDNEIDDIEKLEFEKHISTCKNCREAYENLKNMIEELNNIDRLDLPFGYHNELMNRIKAENTQEDIQKKALKHNKKILDFSLFFSRKNISAAASFIFIFLIMGSGLKLISDNINDKDNQPEEIIFNSYSIEDGNMLYENQEGNNDGATSFSLEAIDEGQMPQARGFALEEHNPGNANVIKNYNLSIIVDDFEIAMAKLNTINSYISSESKDNIYKNSDIVLKVPNDNIDTVIAELRAIGKVESENTSEESIAYMLGDINAKLIAKQKEYDNLVAMLTKTNTVKDMMAIENRISQVITEKEEMKTNLSYINDGISYPKIYLGIGEKDFKPTEINEKTPLMQRVEYSFIKSINATAYVFENILVLASFLFVPAIVIFVGSLLTYILFKTRRGKDE